MKVDGYQVSKLYESYNGKNNQAAGVNKDAADKTEKSDKVEISGQASDMSNAISLGQKVKSAESPEDRQARIDEIKRLVDSGQYNISSKEVAQSILVGKNLDVRA